MQTGIQYEKDAGCISNTWEEFATSTKHLSGSWNRLVQTVSSNTEDTVANFATAG
jgi:hypothetical protein